MIIAFVAESCNWFYEMVVEMMKTHSLGNVILLVKSLFVCLFVCLSQCCEFQFGWVQYVRFMRGLQKLGLESYDVGQ